MRRATKLRTGNRKLATGNRAPLAEGMIPLRSNGQRDWASLTDENLVRYVKIFIKEKRISGRKEMLKADPGSYHILRKRGLLNKVGFDEKRRAWKEVEDEKLIKYARRFMQENGINRRKELEKADQGLYTVLRKRGLLDKVGFEKKNREERSWKKMKDEEIIEHARKFMKEKGINGKRELEKADSGLYSALRRRRLLDDVGFEEKRPKRRPWNKMKSEELIEHATRFMKEEGLSGKRELQKTDSGLYQVLMRRGLLDSVGFEEKHRSWEEMKDEEIIELAKRFIKEDGIDRMGELRKADSGLYYVLRKRGLQDRIDFEEKRRYWGDMGDEELIKHTKIFMKEKGIRGKCELEKTDLGLYTVLRKRRLLDRVRFEEKRRPWKEMKDEEIIELAKRFIKEDGIKLRKELFKADSGLYAILKQRGLLDRVGLKEKRRDRSWNRMNNEELIEHAKRFIKENGITGRKKLSKSDHGLYDVLRRRKLIDQVFSDIERSKQRAFRKQLLLGLSQAADSMEAFGERG